MTSIWHVRLVQDFARHRPLPTVTGGPHVGKGSCCWLEGDGELNRKRRLRPAVAALAAFFLFQSAAISAANNPKDAAPRQVTPRGELSAEETSTIDLFERSRDSVVFITTSRRVEDFWSRNTFMVPKGSGSGFLWDQSGHVVTNYHVIQDANDATVRTADGKEFKAKLVGASPMHDIAVLKIDVSHEQSPPLPLGSSYDLKVGQKVYAIGNPFGLDWTLTNGIVSALNRSLTEENGVTVEHLIQTNAAINPGNSGGPLLDSAGRLIGINTAIYSPSGASAGIGFAVPVDTVNRVVPQLIGFGRYIRPSLGIAVDENINERIARILGTKGVIVLGAPNGSAAKAAGIRGLKTNLDGSISPEDIITAVEDGPVDSVSKLVALLDDFNVGDKVRLTVIRHGKRRVVTVSLQSGGS